jgi:hypothetical protein
MTEDSALEDGTLALAPPKGGKIGALDGSPSKVLVYYDSEFARPSLLVQPIGVSVFDVTRGAPNSILLKTVVERSLPNAWRNTGC